MTVEFRFSDLDRIAACPASHVESKGRPSVGSEAARFGTAGHAVYEALARGEEIDYATICAAHGVGDRSDELRTIITEAVFHPYGEAEVPVTLAVDDKPDSPIIEGTVDLVVPDDCAVIDYKFGRDMIPVDQRLQVPAYAWAVAVERGWDGVTAQVFHPRLKAKGWSTARYTGQDIEDGIEQLRTLTLSARHQMDEPIERRSYSPGDHCVFCPGRVTCPAIRTELMALASLDKPQLPVERDRVPHLVAFAKQLEKRAKAVIELARADVQTLGDIHGDGLSLVGTIQMRTPSLSAKSILEWLEQHGHGEVAASCQADLKDRPKIETFVMRVKQQKGQK